MFAQTLRYDADVHELSMAIHQIQTIFRGAHDLILDFNQFLPASCVKIEIADILRFEEIYALSDDDVAVEMVQLACGARLPGSNQRLTVRMIHFFLQLNYPIICSQSQFCDIVLGFGLKSEFTLLEACQLQSTSRHRSKG